MLFFYLRARSRLAAFAGFFVLFLARSSLWAQQNNADASDPARAAVSLDLANVPLKNALADLFAQVRPAGVTYAVSPEANLDVPVTIRFSQVSFEKTLRALLDFSFPKITFTRTGKTYTILTWSQAPPLLEVKNADTRKTLTQLFDGARAPYRLQADVRGKVTVTVRGDGFGEPFNEDEIATVRLEQKLDGVTRAARPRLTWFRENGVYVVTRAAKRRLHVTVPVVRPVARRGADGSFLQKLLERWLDGSRVRGVVAPDARNQYVFAGTRFDDMPLDQALSILCRSHSPRLAWHWDEHEPVIFVTLRDPKPPTGP